MYRLLVTEVLLRRTGAAAVAAFLPAFLETYPDPARLAAAGEDELSARLRHLGLSRQRAAQLRELAARVEGGPASPTRAELMALPGIGRYSAGIVVAVTGEKSAAVDTNVARVVCRIFDVTPSHAEPRKSTNVWAEAEALAVLSDAPADVTWAILDLAAAVCLPHRPRCTDCPVIQWCAHAARK